MFTLSSILQYTKDLVSVWPSQAVESRCKAWVFISKAGKSPYNLYSIGGT